MKFRLSVIAEKIKGIFLLFCRSSKNMVLQMDEYIDDQIEERYGNMITGKPREDRKAREKVKFLSGMIFMVCIVLLLAVPFFRITAIAKSKIIEGTIKSPDEMLYNLSDNSTENYPEVEMLSGVYIPETKLDQIGGFWTADSTQQNAVITNDGEFMLEGEIGEGESSTVNF